MTKLLQKNIPTDKMSIIATEENDNLVIKLDLKFESIVEYNELLEVLAEDAEAKSESSEA